MDPLKARALFAVATLYTTARTDLDLPACNIYANAADVVAPGIMSIGRPIDETLTTIASRDRLPSSPSSFEVNGGRTIPGLGLPTVAINTGTANMKARRA